MPGRESLRQQQYYAHPRNAFWPIIEALLGLPPGHSYPARVAALKAADIALWDVLQSCERSSSLDADIAEHSIVPNAIGDFLAAHPGVAAIYFNGAKAEQSFRRYVLPALGASTAATLALHRLPSTSPAHAALGFAAKLAAWQILLDGP